MNKMELISKVAKETKLTNRDATEVIEATIENIMKALAARRRCPSCRLRNLQGIAAQGESTGRNPRTGETDRIPSAKNPKFRAGKTFEAVNG